MKRFPGQYFFIFRHNLDLKCVPYFNFIKELIAMKKINQRKGLYGELKRQSFFISTS